MEFNCAWPQNVKAVSEMEIAYVGIITIVIQFVSQINYFYNDYYNKLLSDSTVVLSM